MYSIRIGADKLERSLKCSHHTILLLDLPFHTVSFHVVILERSLLNVFVQIGLLSFIWTSITKPCVGRRTALYSSCGWIELLLFSLHSEGLFVYSVGLSLLNVFSQTVIGMYPIGSVCLTMFCKHYRCVLYLILLYPDTIWPLVMYSIL
jgi:hypothetical protein